MGRLYIVSRSAESFADRVEAGRELSRQLADLKGQDVTVLGIPRGGLVVAREVADFLGAWMDVALTRKLRAPGNPELAIGSITETGKVFIDQRIARIIGADDDYVREESARAMAEIVRRAAQYRAVHPKMPVEGRVAVLTDDGVATGSTMQAAIWAVRQERPSRLIVALPVGPDDTLRRLGDDADEVICLHAPPAFQAVGQFYRDFTQVTDEDVLELLAAHGDVAQKR